MATLLKKRFLAQFVQESLMNVENTIKEEKSDVLLIDIENNISDDERNNKKLNEKISNNDTPLYCVCRKPYDEREFMIGCDGCKNWFHGRCVGITPQQAETIDNYYCSDCLKFSPSMRINGSRKRAIPRPVKTQITATPRKPAECVDRGEDDSKIQLRRSTRLDSNIEKKPNNGEVNPPINVVCKTKEISINGNHTNGVPHKNGVGRPPKKKLLLSGDSLPEKPKSPRLANSAEPPSKSDYKAQLSPQLNIVKPKPTITKIEISTEVDNKKIDNKRKKDDSEATADENPTDEPPRPYTGKKRGRKRKKLLEEPAGPEQSEKPPEPVNKIVPIIKKEEPIINKRNDLNHSSSKNDVRQETIEKKENEIENDNTVTKERKKPGRKKKKHKPIDEVKLPDIAPRRAKLAAYFPDDYKKPIKPEKKKRDGGSTSSSSEESYEESNETSSESESESSEDSEKKKEPVYCICQRPYDNRSFMLRCTTCKDWYHGSCLGLTWQEAKKRKPFICPKCEKPTGSPKRK